MDQKGVKTIICEILLEFKGTVFYYLEYIFKMQFGHSNMLIAAQETFIIFINVETSFCSHSKDFLKVINTLFTIDALN